VSCAPGVGCGFASTVSFRTPTQPLPMEHNPRKVFYQLFGQGDTDEERHRIINETGSILDHVREKAARMSASVGPADRAMLSDYLDSVREIERRIQKMSQPGASNVQLPDAPLGVPEDFSEQVKIMFELIALAWQANKTRVASFMIAKEVSMRTYNQIGVSDAFHPLSHHQNDPAKLEKLAKIQTYHTTLFATFLKRLSETKDGDGSAARSFDGSVRQQHEQQRSAQQRSVAVAVDGARLREDQRRAAPALCAGHAARQPAADDAGSGGD
jgi:hypothetical protein